MRRFESCPVIVYADPATILLEILLSLLVVGGYITVESIGGRPASEIIVGRDALWHPPSQIRQLTVLIAFCLPVTFGAIIAAWFGRRPVFAACWVVVTYFLVLFFPFLSDDNLPFPLTEVADLPSWVVAGVLLVNGENQLLVVAEGERIVAARRHRRPFC